MQQEMKEPFHMHAQDLQNLLASPIIQEKLYSEDKCLVPKEFVETLANDPEIQSKPMVFQGIDQLLRTNIGGHSWLTYSIWFSVLKVKTNHFVVAH